MSIPFIDLKTQYARIKDKVMTDVEAVFDSGMFIMGPASRELESRMVEYTGARHALGCASGTDALIMALMALGIGQGDAVFTTPFTFMATAESVALLGATPVFVDIETDTFNIDPVSLEKVIEETKSNHPELTPKAVIAVDLFGQPADYDKIVPLAEKHGLKLIVDAAQSFGATINGKSTCAIGDIACTSFFPAKPLGCYGDGGMCYTNSDELAEIMASVRVHGQGSDKYDNVRLGINGRLDTVQSAVLNAKLDIFPEELESRQKVADNYAELLEGTELDAPRIRPEYVSAWAQYTVLARDEEHRTQCMEKLKEAGVPTAIYYPLPLHLQKAFANLGYSKGDLPVSEGIGQRVFSLPMHPYLDRETQEIIVAPLKK